MTAAENLARWREAEQGAAEGPWYPYLVGPTFKGDGSDWIVDSAPTFICSTHNDDERSERDSAFIATSREAMPALLAFAEAALAAHTPLADSCSAMYPRPICGGCYNEDWPCSVVRLAEQHLGGAR